MTDLAGLTVWGSECLSCGNATPASDVCDNCGSSERTTPLYMSEDAVYDD